jgi:predicted dehydrogenase
MRVALVMEADEQGHRAFFLQALRDLDLVQRVVVVDETGMTFEEAERTLGSKLRGTHTNMDAILENDAADLAIVSLIAAHAPPVVRRCLEHRLHVMVEKPACTHPDQFAPLVALAEKQGRNLIVPLARRLSPWVQEARRLVDGGAFGRIYALRGGVIADQTRLHPPDGKYDWTFSRTLAGGGHLIWLGIHWIDLMTYITRSSVVEVQALTGVVGGAPIDVEDLALVNLKFENGAYGSLTSGYLLDVPYQLDLSLWGSDGWLRFGAADQHRLEWHSKPVGLADAVTRQVTYSGSEFPNYTPWIERTLRCCTNNGKRPPITGSEALNALRVVHAAYTSAETGRTVAL